jgi:hypothetical protein
MFILHVLVFVAKTLVLSQACSSNPKDMKCYECQNCTYVSDRNIGEEKGELVKQSIIKDNKSIQIKSFLRFTTKEIR